MRGILRCSTAVSVCVTLAALSVSQGRADNVPSSLGDKPKTYAEWAVPLYEDYPGLLTVCFDQAGPPDDEFIADMKAALAAAGRLYLENPEADYDLGVRWSGGQGSPRALTWSFVPDGLTIPNGIGEGSGTSVLFQILDSQYSAQGGRATWVARIQSCFDRWQALSGLSFTRIKHLGQDWDDGAVWGADGSTTRGDIRIAMKFIDGESGVLGYTSYPSEGDMVLDRQENWGAMSSMNRFLRNVVAHELGHAFGVSHVCSNDAAFLMEPLLSTFFDGPRHDDIRAIQRHYGDPRENDNTSATAVDLGTPTPGVAITNFCTLPAPLSGSNPPNTSNCSVDANGELDWLKFTVTKPSTASVTVAPAGFTYDDNNETFSGCPSGLKTNSLAITNLAVQLYAPNGTTILATAEAAAIGLSETLTDIALVSAGTYFIRVYESSATQTQSQLYTLSLLVKDDGGPPPPPPCLGDLDMDGVVGQTDLGALLACYELCGAGDVDGDGDTDQSDLGILLAAWGPCP
jgi:hypothetical protein